MNLARYRVAASCFEPDKAHEIGQRRDALRVHMTTLLEEQRPDLLVLPENAIVPDLDGQTHCGAEPLDGPTVEMVSEMATRFTANICIPLIEDDEGVLFNTAVYVDRRGKVAGAYRKRVPTVGEIERGIHPGGSAQQPVVLDGLRMGTAICFDQNYPDLLWNWIASGVDLLIFPAYTYSGNLMRNWAVNCGVPLVCAFPWESIIYDRDGRILVEAGTMTDTVRFGYHATWIACNLTFRSRVYHLDGNQTLLREIAARYGGKVDIRLMVRDARMMITVVSDDVELDQLEHEMGLVPLQEYLRKCRLAASRISPNAGETRSPKNRTTDGHR